MDSFNLRFMWGLWDKGDIPHIIKERHDNMKKKFSCKISVHGKDDIENLVEKYTQEFDSDFSKLYHNIQRKVARADLGRYLLIFYMGGIYLDNDAIIKNINPYLNLSSYKNGIWEIEKIVNVNQLGPLEKPISKRIANYIIATPPQSMILLEILKESSCRVKSRLEKGGEWSDSDILWATGPDVVTTIVDKWDMQSGILICKENVEHFSEGTWRNGQDKTEFVHHINLVSKKYMGQLLYNIFRRKQNGRIWYGYL